MQHHLQLQLLAKVAHHLALNPAKAMAEGGEQHDPHAQCREHVCVTTHQDIVGEDLHQHRHPQGQAADHHIQHQCLQEQPFEGLQELGEDPQSLFGWLIFLLVEARGIWL